MKVALAATLAALLAVLLTGCGGATEGEATQERAAEPAAVPAAVPAEPGSAGGAHAHRPAPPELIASDPALAFVRSFDIASDLVGICRAVARTTEAYRQAVAIGGDPAAADAEIDKALADVERDHKEAFERELALAYGALLQPDELRSLAAEGLASKHAPRLLAVRDAAGDRAVAAFRATIESVAGLAASFAKASAERVALGKHIASGAADPKLAEFALLPEALDVNSLTTPREGATPAVRLLVRAGAPTTIAEFGWMRHDGTQWRLGEAYGAEDFGRRFDCADGRVKTTGFCATVLSDAEVARARDVRTLWYFVGVENGEKRVQGQMELRPESLVAMPVQAQGREQEQEQER